MVRRMPRVQVYLPDDLYRQLKERALPASELLQDAVRSEIQRQVLLEAADEYVRGLVEEVGEPSPDAVARAEAVAARISRRQATSQTG
jgi:metal-responsive CopG/Arc/MetJ family transcriptional regulator